MSRWRLPLVVLLAVLVVASAIALVWMRHRTRVLFVELTALQKQRDALNIEFARQQIEQATWAEPSRVERVARQRLGMIDPPASAMRLVEQ